jgi:hypothetical protein
MSKVWGGGRGGCAVGGVGFRGGAVVVVGVALEDMVFVVSCCMVQRSQSWMIALRK